MEETAQVLVDVSVSVHAPTVFLAAAVEDL
jgi:hypothetical protein